MDLHDRKIIGWSLRDGMSTNKTTLASCKRAIRNRTLQNVLIFHCFASASRALESDQGIQYANNKFANFLESYKVSRSVSRTGSCWVNAVAESFFKSLKAELIYGNKLISKEQMKLQSFENFEIWYNHKIPHSSLKYQTITKFNNLLNNYKMYLNLNSIFYLHIQLSF